MSALPAPRAKDPEGARASVDCAAEALDAAASTLLVRIGAAFRSTMKFNDSRFDPASVDQLVAKGMLVWRIPNEIAEITHAGRARVKLSRARALNAARMRQLLSDLKR